MLWVLVGVGLFVFTIAAFVLVGLVLWRKAKRALGDGRQISARASALAAEAGALAERVDTNVPGR